MTFKLKYDPYVQKVRKDIAQVYWSLRRDGKKELAALMFKRQKLAHKMMIELFVKDLENGFELF
jgi:hypothetical protein